MAVSNAPAFLKDRRYSEGIGVRVGDFELHPGVAGEFGYDSNWLYRTTKTGPNITNGNPVDAWVMRITPSLSLSTLTQQRKEGDTSTAEPPKVAFRSTLAATYRKFFGDAIIRQQDSISALGNLRLDILPQRPFGAAVYGNVERTIQASAQGIPFPATSFNRVDFGGGAELIAIPGGGTLDWRVGYTYAGTRYEETVGTGFNRDTHNIYTRGRWKARPRTAFLFDGTFTIANMPDKERATYAVYYSTPIRARLGVSTLFTPRVSLLAMAGYGGSFNDAKGAFSTVKQFDSIIGQAEMRFYLTANPAAPEDGNVSLALSSLAVGFTRDFSNNLLGGYITNNRGYAQLLYSFAGRLALTLEGGVAGIQYPQALFTSGAVINDGWTDLRLDASLYGEYRFTNTVALMATVRYTQNISNTQLPISPTSTNVFDLNWQRFEGFLGVRWFM